MHPYTKHLGNLKDDGRNEKLNRHQHWTLRKSLRKWRQKTKRGKVKVKKITLQNQCRRPTLQIIVIIEKEGREKGRMEIAHKRVQQKFPEENEFPGLSG